MNKIFITLLIITTFSTALFSAEKNNDNEIPDVAIGINGNYGSFDMYQKNIDLEPKPGMYTGGGISVEKMIYEKFGVGSGIQYRYFRTDFNMDGLDATWTFQSINIPLLMILSFSGPKSAIHLVGGVVYSHIFYSVMTTDSTMPIPNNYDNALKYINTNQIGLTAGVLFIIKATEYSDFQFGLMAEGYPTNLLYQRDKSTDRLDMINYSLTTGWRFRTNIFPGSKKE